MDFLDRHPREHRIAEIPDPLGIRAGEFPRDLIVGRRLVAPPAVLSVGAESEAVHFEPAKGLLERLLERPPDGHRLADRLHLRRERRIRFGKLLECESRDLRYHVVDRWFETGGRLA